MSGRLAAAALLLATATPAFAQPNYRLTPVQVRTQKIADQWEFAYIGLSAIDAAETIYGIKSGRADEANPLFGKHPSALKIVAAKIAFGAMQYTLYREVRRKSPQTALRVAQISVVMQGAIVGLNLRVLL